MSPNAHPRKPEFEICAVSAGNKILATLGTYPTERMARQAATQLDCCIPNVDRIIIYKTTWNSVHTVPISNLSNRDKLKT